MEVKIEKLSRNAVIPSYSKYGDAGLDLVATSVHFSKYKSIVEYGTDLAIEIPFGYVGLIFPRSSIYKHDMILLNSVGVIDSGYRGEIKFKFWYQKRETAYEVGDRIGQLIIIPYPQIKFVETDKLSETERGTGGYGSTGR